MTTNTITAKQVWQVLNEIPDPEIPVISIVDLGIVREVKVEGDVVAVTITPTYSGCPAMKMIETDIVKSLNEKGYGQVSVTSVLAPAWTTDWITEEARAKLRAYGIAPPEKTTADKSALTGQPQTIRCPRCSSERTTLRSPFGSTPCKALYSCDDCQEPFDYFKCI